MEQRQQRWCTSRGVGMAKGQRSESRQLTEFVGVRLTTDDLDELREEASRQGVTVPRLLRDITLNTLRAAS
jgi:hypothetical protein